eukprot:PRCOL_00001535-RA
MMGGGPAGGGNGLFTQTTPEARRIKPDPRGRPVVKIVYVVLEAQYQSSLTDAVASINKKSDDFCVEMVGYLLEELRDPDNFETFKKDVGAANVFIGSLIFVEDLAEKLRVVVEAERPRLDACLIFPSMPAVMRLNKLGSFSMSQLGQSKSAIGSFMKKQKENNDNFEEGLLKLIRTLPKVLKYLPAEKAQDARRFMMSLQYWLGGSSDNLENFLTMISDAYVPALADASLEFGEPVVFPDVGIWHPTAPRMYEDVNDYLSWCNSRSDIKFAPDAPTVGLVLQRSHLVTGDEGHYAGMVSQIEAMGARCIPIFSGALDFSGPVKDYFYDGVARKPLVDSVVSLTGFALVGGPARQDHPKAIETLKMLNVPYMVSLPLVFQTTEEWKDSTLGLHPVQVALQVALPELDGGIEPVIFSGRDSRTGKSHSMYDRIDVVARRAVKYASLRTKKAKDKKLAITVFSFPPDKGNVGTAAYLNVFSSIYRVMREMKRQGYTVDLPRSEEELLEQVISDKEAKLSSPELNIAYRMSKDEYEELTPYSKDLEESWGPPPGNLNSDGQNLLIYGKDSYQSLKDTGRGEAIVGTIVATAKTVNLDKDVDLPEEDAIDSLSDEERDNVVGSVYQRLMEIESRLLPTGLHVIGDAPSAEEAVATLVNIASIDREEEGIRGIPDILAEARGTTIDEVYKQNDLGTLEGVQLNKDITDATRAAVRAFVGDVTDFRGKVKRSLKQDAFTVAMGKLFKKEPSYVKALNELGFEGANKDDLRGVFDYLSFCLTQNSSWSDESQLQEMYLERKSFAFNSDTPGSGMDENRQIFESALQNVDATFQNLDSSEISLTDVSHYFDSDPTKLVASVRKDGKMPSAEELRPT